MLIKWLLCQFCKNEISESRSLMVKRGRTWGTQHKKKKLKGRETEKPMATFNCSLLSVQRMAVPVNLDIQDPAQCQAGYWSSTYCVTERWQKLCPHTLLLLLWLPGPYFRERDFTNRKNNLSCHKLQRNRTWSPW